MTRYLFACLFAVGAAFAAAAPPPASPPATSTQASASLPRVTPLAKTRIQVGAQAIAVEVADTAATRETGLMYRFSIAPDEGMLFVFPVPQPLSFWMHNTYMPLSIAFIDAQGRVLNIEDMAPRTDDGHLSHGEALYALEMRQGWFRRHGIEPGVIVRRLPPPSRE